MKKVFVGLSGGVDSAVSAALLQREGYDVTGVFIKIWRPEFLECTWKEDRLDAMRVCVALGIPFLEIDFSEQYKREVIDAMVADYARGITPNPDVHCNRAIKFGSFASWSLEAGADYIATGHYARAHGAELYRGADREKDQSYFLHLITAPILQRTLFPVGSLKKREVRELAKKYKLPVARKRDSQGLCFVGDVSIEEFLTRYIPLTRGRVLDEDGAVVGEHSGAALYTIGQRHGFSTRSQKALYITDVDTRENTIKVSTERSRAARNSFSLEGVHWIGEHPNLPANLLAQSRYREKAFGIRLLDEGARLRIETENPRLVSKGQSLVFYDGDKVLGGGGILYQ